MAKALHSTNMGLGQSEQSNRTRYWPIAASYFNNGISTSESVQLTTFRSAGTISNLFINVITNDVNATTTLTLRKNQAAGSESITISALSTGIFEDTSNTDSITAGDTVGAQIAIGNSGANRIYWDQCGFTFAASSNTVSRLGLAGRTWGSANGIAYQAIMGESSPNGNTTESQTYHTLRAGGTLKNAQCVVAANNRSVNVVVTTRINGADGNLAVTITSSTTGSFEDTTNSDAVSAADAINWKYDNGTGSGAVNSTVFVDFETANHTSLLYNQRSSITNLSANQTGFLPVSGANITALWSAENDTRTVVSFDFTGSDLEANVALNSVNGDSTLTMRIDNANGNQSVTITSSTTGSFRDTSNTDDFLDGDNINYQLAVGGSTGTLAIRTLGMLGAVAAGSRPYMRRVSRFYMQH